MVIYLILSIFILGINIVPAFMPPTWIILTYFYSHYHLSLVPTILIGATMTTLGRVILANLAGNYLRPFLPKRFEQNYDTLGQFLKKNQKLTIPLLFTYAFLPVPSNDVFIIAGLAKLRLRLIAGAFFCGRLISDTFWVSLASQVSTRLDSVFSRHFANWGAIAAETLGLLIVLLVGQINWKKILKISD